MIIKPIGEVLQSCLDRFSLELSRQQKVESFLWTCTVNNGDSAGVQTIIL